MNGFFLHIDLQFVTNSSRNQVKIKIKTKKVIKNENAFSFYYYFYGKNSLKTLGAAPARQWSIRGHFSG